MKFAKPLIFSLVISVTTLLPAEEMEKGSVIFIHPDGTGLGHWNAARHLYAGPDGMLNWDRMERLGAYRAHQKNLLTSTSHSGATVHAYGKKVHFDSYGLDRLQPLEAVSGKPLSIMEEAMAAGIRCGIVNSGHIGEPGTGVFLASSPKRGMVESIAADVLESGAEVIFCGGEIFLLPEGEVGVHGVAGTREDGRNLLEEAKKRGYKVIYTRKELLDLSSDTEKVIGIFAATNTYNDRPEADLEEAGLATYDPEAPTFDEMNKVALRILSHDPAKRFFLVAEEEGTDNFSNKMNAKGMLDAIGRADRGIGDAMALQETNPDRNILLLVGSDSDAGNPTIWVPWNVNEDVELPRQSDSGAMIDGVDGTGGRAFLSKPDQYGNRYPFGIAWATKGDYPGSTVNKAHGYGSHLLGVSVDNTAPYRIMYSVLFGEAPGED